MIRDAESPLQRQHRECWERIPWLANETLDPREYARIEPHLHACRECQNELEEQQRVRAAMRSHAPIVLAPQTALQKLMQRIDAEEAAAPCAETDVQTPEREPAAPSRRIAQWARWVPVAAAVQGVVLALVLATQQRADLEAPRFETLTTEPAMRANGPVLRVVFEAGVSMSDVNAILRSVGAQIVAGPTEAGVYTLALKLHGERMDAATDAALAQLRADARVLFAETAVTRSTP
jgi:hypothetical protein